MTQPNIVPLGFGVGEGGTGVGEGGIGVGEGGIGVGEGGIGVGEGGIGVGEGGIGVGEGGIGVGVSASVIDAISTESGSAGWQPTTTRTNKDNMSKLILVNTVILLYDGQKSAATSYQKALTLSFEDVLARVEAPTSAYKPTPSTPACIDSLAILAALWPKVLADCDTHFQVAVTRSLDYILDTKPRFQRLN